MAAGGGIWELDYNIMHREAYIVVPMRVGLQLDT